VARDFLIVVRRYSDSEENCYSQHHVASSMDDAIRWFAKQRGFNLNWFLDENGREENCKKKMVYAMPYWRDPKKMAKVNAIKRETETSGNKLPGYLDKYRQPEPPSNYPIELMPEQPKRASFPVKDIPIPTKNVENETERDLPDTKKDLSDFAKRVLYYANLEHTEKKDDYQE